MRSSSSPLRIKSSPTTAQRPRCAARRAGNRHSRAIFRSGGSLDDRRGPTRAGPRHHYRVARRSPRRFHACRASRMACDETRQPSAKKYGCDRPGGISVDHPAPRHRRLRNGHLQRMSRPSLSFDGTGTIFGLGRPSFFHDRLSAVPIARRRRYGTARHFPPARRGRSSRYQRPRVLAGAPIHFIVTALDFAAMALAPSPRRLPDKALEHAGEVRLGLEPDR
jgi:hypothetical protein